MNAGCSENESDNIYQPSCSTTTPFKSIIDNYIPVKRGFKLASLNINSLSAHIDEVRILLDDKCLDVLAIQETKLNESNNDCEFYIPGYEIIRRDRLSDGGGGVCFYVKTSINFSLRTDLNMDNLENLCTEIRKPHSKPLIVVTWYRPPNSPVGLYSHLETLIGRIDLTNFEFYLLGDMNVNMASTNYDNDVRQLTNIADIYGLHQLIKEPTRITDKSSTLIDLIFTNCPERVVCSGVGHISISDHSLVYVYRKLSIDFPKGHNSIIYRSFKKFNRSEFRNDICNHDWEFLNLTEDPNQLWSEWKTKFQLIVDKHAPIRSKRVRSKNSPWISIDLKQRMHMRDVLKIKAIKSNNPHDWVNFRRMRNKVNTDIKSAKELYYKNKFINTDNDPRKTWQLINELTSRKSDKSSIKELKLNGVSIINAPDLSNAFNNHFSSIGPKLANDIPLSDGNCTSYQEYINGIDKSFQFRPTNDRQVLTFLNKLNKFKSTGLDKISSRLIRYCADVISPHLTIIFNRSLVTGIFPDDWKAAKVTPLFKQGDRSDMNNYRPISVISVVAKVFERIVYNQLSNYLSEHNILSKHQSGFRSFHSTVTALLETTDSWAYNIDHGNVNAVVFLDLKKAFDTVDHHILLSKLHLYGINGIAHRWFSSYLDNRTQKCFVNGSLSNTCTLKCGVPQGLEQY